MKKLILLFAMIAIGMIAHAQVNSNKVYVNGYTKSNGTYVKGHYRTAPNNTINDNYSTKGNTNPYTGKQGTVPRETNTYSTPSYNSTYKAPTSTYSTPSYNTPTYKAPTSTYSTPSYTTPKYDSYYNTQPKEKKKSTNTWDW